MSGPDNEAGADLTQVYIALICVFSFIIMVFAAVVIVALRRRRGGHVKRTRSGSIIMVKGSAELETPNWQMAQSMAGRPSGAPRPPGGDKGDIGSSQYITINQERQQHLMDPSRAQDDYLSINGPGAPPMPPQEAWASPSSYGSPVPGAPMADQSYVMSIGTPNSAMFGSPESYMGIRNIPGSQLNVAPDPRQMIDRHPMWGPGSRTVGIENGKYRPTSQHFYPPGGEFIAGMAATEDQLMRILTDSDSLTADELSNNISIGLVAKTLPGVIQRLDNADLLALGTAEGAMQLIGILDADVNGQVTMQELLKGVLATLAICG